MTRSLLLPIILLFWLVSMVLEKTENAVKNKRIVAKIEIGIIKMVIHDGDWLSQDGTQGCFQSNKVAYIYGSCIE